MAGLTYSHTFEESGEFPYFCMVHPWMTGTVTVLGSSNSIKLKLMKSNFQEGDTMFLAGRVDYTVESFAMETYIFDPFGNLIFINQSMVQNDRTFQEYFSIGGVLFKTSGIYKIELKYDDATLERYFWFESDSGSNKNENILSVENLTEILDNCDVIECEIIPRLSVNINTEITWFNPKISIDYLSIKTLNGFNQILNFEEILPQNISSYSFDTPGDYVYYLSTSPEYITIENVKMFGVIHVDDDSGFSSEVDVESSSSTSTENGDFTNAQVDWSSASVVTGEIAHIQVQHGTSVPGCETTLDCFLPSNLVIKKGATVIWSNDDSAAHTVTGGNAADGPSGIFDSSLFMAGTTFSHTCSCGKFTSNVIGPNVRRRVK